MKNATEERNGALDRCAVDRTTFTPDQDRANLYLGSGRCGASVDAFGLMNGAEPGPGRALGAVGFMHADHWSGGRFGLDYHLPFLSLRFAHLPSEPERYRQQLDIRRGVATTFARGVDYAYRLRLGFSPEFADVMCVQFVEVEGAVPDLELTGVRSVTTTHGDELVGEASSRLLRADSAEHVHGGLTFKIGSADSMAVVRAPGLECDGPRIVIRRQVIRPGATIYLVAGAAGRSYELLAIADSLPDADAFFERSAVAWSRRWGDAFVSLPDEQLHGLWGRSAFSLLSSYGPDVRMPSPAMGWSGNGWQYNFPQDLSYVSPALLALGHTDIVRSWIEFFAGCIEPTEEHTSRIYGAKGTFWAWEHPIGCTGGLLEGLECGEPNWFQYEIHNAAYPAQMAIDAAIALGDSDWSRDIAWPVVRGSCRFFASILERESDGTYGIHVKPAMGQNEFDTHNRANYLCSLFAATSTLRRGVVFADRFGLNDGETARWLEPLRAGLAFGRLVDDQHGIFATSEWDETRFLPGTQKHPIQLDPYFSIPIHTEDWSRIRLPTEAAYAHQELMCRPEADRLHDGWTLFSRTLSAARMGDTALVAKLFADLVPTGLVDDEWVQIYESSVGLFRESRVRYESHYTTNAGLYLQTIHSAFGNEFAGYTRRPGSIEIARDWRASGLAIRPSFGVGLAGS